MEDFEQEPEEIPMEEVLAEIRQMLSAEVKEEPIKCDKKVEPVLGEFKETTIDTPKTPRVMQPEKPIVIHKEPEIFILTPAMRCDIPVAKALSQNVQKQTQKVLDKLQKDAVAEPKLSPELIAWLNNNLPSLIEKTVKERLS